MSYTRVLVIGIDGANPDLLLRWSADGTMPNLAGLLKRGQWSKTRGLEGFFIGSTWPSIYTGTSPARHGFHYQVQLKPGTYDFHRPEDHGLVYGKTFWRALSDAGRRVAILDAPLSALDSTLNGMQIVEWGGHDQIYGFRTHPAPLAESIRTRFGEHPVGTSCDAIRRSADDYRAFVNTLVRGVNTKTEITREFLREGGWDLFMQVFSETHCVGHQCWHLHDPTHPAHDAAISTAIGGSIERVYRSIDTAIGSLIEEAGDCMTFVFSSHGMSHWYGAQFLLREILFRLEVAHRPQPAERSRDLGSLALAGAARVWHQLPGPIRTALGGLRQRYGPEIAESSIQPTLGVDVARSRCFPLSNGLALGGIRLNLVGREPQGNLTPGQEADDFCKALTEDLMAIIDDRTGEPVIRSVLRVSDLYQGPRLADLPDLVVDYSDAVATGSTIVGSGDGAAVRLHSPKIGIVEGTNTYGRTGEHRSQGLLLAAGPGIAPGSFAHPVSVLDLAPTWARALGIELESANGTPIIGLPPAR